MAGSYFRFGSFAAGAVLVLFGEALPLWWRRKYPVAALLVIAGVEIVKWAAGLSNEPSGPALVFAVYAVSVYDRTVARLIVAAAAIAIIAIAVALLVFGQFALSRILIPAGATSLVAWVIGDYMRSRRQRVSGNSSKEALQSIESTARDTLAELNRLLGVLRKQSDDAPLTPQPGLDQVEALMKTVRDAGLEATLKVTGERRPLPAALDLSAYRILQESVTNVLKHAHASRVEITVAYQPDAVLITVSDNGIGEQQTAGASTGHGLIGVRERVELFNGELASGSGSLGGYVVHAKLMT